MHFSRHLWETPQNPVFHHQFAAKMLLTAWGQPQIKAKHTLPAAIHCWSGWWFQTFLIFHNIWDNPSH
jgi:hypothetical protein